MSEERFSEVRNRILQAENILLATHLKPDVPQTMTPSSPSSAK